MFHKVIIETILSYYIEGLHEIHGVAMVYTLKKRNSSPKMEILSSVTPSCYSKPQSSDLVDYTLIEY